MARRLVDRHFPAEQSPVQPMAAKPFVRLLSPNFAEDSFETSL